MASNVQCLAMKYATLFFEESLLFFPDTYSSVGQKFWLRRLISENTRKTTSSMTLVASRKTETISHKGVFSMKTRPGRSRAMPPTNFFGSLQILLCLENVLLKDTNKKYFLLDNVFCPQALKLGYGPDKNVGSQLLKTIPTQAAFEQSLQGTSW